MMITKMKIQKLQLVILFSFIISMVDAAHGKGNETDLLALLKVKDSLRVSDANSILDSWNQSVHFCQWLGVRCSRRHDRVVNLNLAEYGFGGQLSSYVGNLSFLRILGISGNNLEGEIPYEIGYLFRLRKLKLANNSFVGKIPTSLSNCTKLTYLGLSGNGLIGEIPSEFSFLTNVRKLYFARNKLTRKIPPSFGNLTTLRYFSVSDNMLEGEIPEEIGLIKTLQYFSCGINFLSGSIPSYFFNSSSIRLFYVPINHLTGTLPTNMFIDMPFLKEFSIAQNEFTGSIPAHIANGSHLRIFQVNYNNFTGQIPTNFGVLEKLEVLGLYGNKLGRNSSDDLSFIRSLTNCSNLRVLDFAANNMGGTLVSAISNLSTSLAELYLGGNNIHGQIPVAMGNLIGLRVLSMWENNFSGFIPDSFGNLFQLRKLYLFGNRLSGRIPSSNGNLTVLLVVDLSSNMLEGSIPPSIENWQVIQALDFSNNKFSGRPNQMLRLSSLVRVLNLSYNHFDGSLSDDIGKLHQITTIDLSHNNISGEIPNTLSDCLSLEYLYMQGNSFQKTVPSSLTLMLGLQILDLSGNHLTGQIPKDLFKINFVYLNLSFNDLEGQIPGEGGFRNSSAVYLAGNPKLCGGVPKFELPKCTVKGNGMSLGLKLIVIIVPSVFLIAALLSVIILIVWRKKLKRKPDETLTQIEKFLMISYRNLYNATQGFSAGSLIGSGGFGTVYKAYIDIPERMLVAVKVLNLEQHGVSTSFLREVNILRNVRHRNVVKILTYCSSLDYKGAEFKALVFEFMENSSLDKWLHANSSGEISSAMSLDLLQRVNVAIDVASAIHYLHDDCETTIIHCDLKPSNILLDRDMVAHVGDFGLARLLFEDQTSMAERIGVGGSIGYIAPEYGMGGDASKSGDVYSYGVLVLEMLTAKRPTDEMFKDGMNLHQFVKNALPDRWIDIVDPNLLTGECGVEVNNCLLSLLEVGVACSAEIAIERCTMADVDRKLQHIKRNFLLPGGHRNNRNRQFRAQGETSPEPLLCNSSSPC